MRPVVTLALTVAVLCLVAGSLPVAAVGQGMESYAFVHPFGLSAATTTRQSGMGGPISCVQDLGFANPAFAALAAEPNAGLRVSSTSFDQGPDLVSEHAHYILPLRRGRDGLQISLFSLRSHSGQVLLPGVGSAVAELSEEDVSVHYGRRLSPRLAAGISLSPHTEIGYSLAIPGGPTLIDVEAEADIGARTGLVYAWGTEGHVGVVYDYYQETARARGVALSGPSERVFHSELLAVGASRRVRPDLTAVIEYQTASTFSGATRGSLSGWHLGAEFCPQARYAVRAGLNDSHLTAGLGLAGERWRVDYSFIDRWNDNIAAGLFGGSDTHQLQAIYRW